MRIALYGDAKGSAQAQVSNLQGICAVIHQQILWLQVPMHHAMLVTVGYPLQQLVHEVLQKPKPQLRDSCTNIGRYAV